jgi:hypothetical protein
VDAKYFRLVFFFSLPAYPNPLVVCVLKRYLLANIIERRRKREEYVI